MNSRFVLKASGDQFYFNLKAGNNEVILTSERYTAKASALKGIEAVRDNAEDDDCYQRRKSGSGQPYFVLRGHNHEVLGTSELYSSASARDEGIRVVGASAPEAELDDETRTGKAERHG
jgi:uncharacterized protein